MINETESLAPSLLARWYTQACIFPQSSNKSATFSRVNFAIKGMEGVNIYITGETRRRLPTREEIISTRFTNLEIRNIRNLNIPPLLFNFISFLFPFMVVQSLFRSISNPPKNMRETHYLAIILKS